MDNGGMCGQKDLKTQLQKSKKSSEEHAAIEHRLF